MNGPVDAPTSRSGIVQIGGFAPTGGGAVHPYSSH
jgi:hypothetical protein